MDSVCGPCALCELGEFGDLYAFAGVEFAKCHELQTKHFLMEGGVGTANPAPCTAPTPLQTLWASYKNLLDSADSTNAADLQQVSISYKEMTEALKPFLRELPLQTAEIQTYLLSKMAALTETLLVQAVFSLSNVNRSSYALALTLSLDLWKAAYESVTEGDLLRGVPELTEQCTMRYMLALKHQWEPFHSKMIDVVDEKPDKTIQMLPKSDDMQDLLQKAIASLTGGSCTPQAISSKQWFYALKRLNYVRKNIHKSAYHMFELEMLYRLGQSGEPTDETTTTLLQDHVRHELSDAAGGLEESLRGTEKLPVAPTQEIVDALLVVRTQFDALKATIEKTLKEHAHSTEIFENIEHSSSDIDKGIDALSLLYLFEAVASGVAPGIANMYFASRQSVFLVELVREALWLFLCQNYSGKDTSKFDYFVNAFESVHKALLEGGKEKYSGIILPHSTDHCVLTQMAYVKQDFGDLRNTMVQLFSYEDFQILQKGYVRAEASTAFLVQAMKDFKAAWVSFRSTDTMRSRDLLVAYHFSNPNAAGSKDKLNSASGPEAYHSVHRKYHPEYRAILYSRNYYDIFFFDLQGNCIYSVFKELDFATNFAATGSGPYRSSGLGEAYQAALAAPEEIHVTPWAPYDPSKGALASFICTGVRDGSELIGVFCTQMPAETRPITVAEMETALDRASKSMDLATSYKVYHPGCTSTISQTAWEQLIAKMSLVEVDSYRIQTEFQLLNAGYSQLWLDQADQGREEQKAKVAASVTTELGDAFVEFKAAWDAYRATNEERLLSLQIRYILLNPFPTGQKDKLDSAEGPETYHEVHQKYHPTYRALLYEKNYYDIFFLDVEGNCIYSVYKELDYATNFAENGGGEWKESGLGDAFRAAMKSPHQVNYIDWKPYGPSNGALASFLSVAVHRGEKMVGVFCTQLPPEIEPRNSSAYLQDFIDDLSTTFEKFRYGSLEDKIYPPPTQPITDGFIAANDIWDQLKPLLIQEEQDMAAVRLLTEQLAEAAASLNPLLLDGAWEAYPALEGAKIQTSASLLLLLQRLTRDAVRFALNGQSAAFQGDIKSVDENLQALMNGRSGRRLVSKNDIDIVSSVEGVELLKLLETAWLLQKPKLVEFFDMTTPGEANLKSLIDAADDTRTAAEKVMQHVSTTTRTTTLIEVHVLTPVPLSGRWAAGQTFRTALRLAESLINNDQLILPGYELKHDIMDDECDGGKGADVVVSANTARDTYVALAGMGCNEVCRQVATLSASLKLPFLSFYCPTPDFSNVAVHPQLARLGTVLEPHLPQIMSELKVRHAWSHIFVISCDSSYSAEAERYVEILQNVGIRPTSLSPASDKRFEDIQNLMSGIKEQTTGEQRVVLVVGDETFFRTLICASITARLHSGLTWISFGVQRSEWWKKSDLSTSAQRQWVSETAGSFQFVKAFTELKTGWDLFRQSTEATRSVLTELYVTELKDALITVDGGESYHQAHQEWHPIYRSLLYRRKYYDIFFFDIEGNMIYSVYKEADFATNFAASSNGPWKDSGLGRVYQEAMANPDDIHYADFAPYGPSGGAEAAFFATGVRDSTDQLIGVYAIQLPPDYQKSIEDQVPECSLEAINAAYEGAVSVVGLGKPVSEDMEKPLPCFKGHSPRSFRALLDHHLQNGFPEGDLSTIVSDPYDDVKGLAVDGACAFAFSLQSMLKQGYTMGQVQHPDDEVYQRFTSFLRTSMDFQGISGRVKFGGNDRANTLAIQQVRQGRSIEVGLVDPQGLRWLGNGTVADAWKIEPVPPFEQMWLIQAALVSLAVICPCMLGLVIGIRMVRKKRALRNAPNVPNALV